MLRTFLIGVLLGLAAAAAAAHYYAVDQVREASIISVAPNGGSTESFHIDIPTDRIMLGAPDQKSALPPGLEWPSDETLANVRSELFKIRDARNAVIGVAARTAAKQNGSDAINWVIHLPARGSMFVTMNPEPQNGSFRIGELSAGSREFDPLSGSVTERWVSDTSGEDDAPIGKIELVATYLGQLEPQE